MLDAFGLLKSVLPHVPEASHDFFCWLGKLHERINLHQLPDKGDGVVRWQATFDLEACLALLVLSGDINAFHVPKSVGEPAVVQFAALGKLLSAAVSRTYTNCALGGATRFVLRAPIMTGDTVTITMNVERLHKGYPSVLSIVVTRGDVVLVERSNLIIVPVP